MNLNAPFAGPNFIPPVVDGRSTADLPLQRTWGALCEMTAEQSRRWQRARRIAYSRRPFFLYRQFDGAGALLYIGVTANPPQREQTHRSQSPWASQIYRTEYEMHPTQWVALAHEEHDIAAQAPLYNRLHSPDRDGARRRIAELRIDASTEEASSGVSADNRETSQ